MYNSTVVVRRLQRCKKALHGVKNRLDWMSLIGGKLMLLSISCSMIPVFASAAPITFTGASGSLAASATFEISGNDLIITLTNTASYNNATDGDLAPGSTLTGIFWDLTGSPSLTPVSATIPTGSILLQSDQCDVGPCSSSTTNVGGEFIFGTSSSFDPSTGTPPSATYGVASSGYISGSIGNFGGPNLDDPDAPDGINFGIVPSGFNAGDGNGNTNSAMNSNPLIRDSIELVLSGVNGLSTDAISNVSFQYGTAFSEANVPSDPLEPPQSIPEPTTLLLFGAGLLGVGLTLRRRSGSHI